MNEFEHLANLVFLIKNRQCLSESEDKKLMAMIIKRHFICKTPGFFVQACKDADYIKVVLTQVYDVVCPICNGTGSIFCDRQMYQCEYCEGQGNLSYKCERC